MNATVCQSIREIIKELQSLQADDICHGTDNPAVEETLNRCLRAIREVRSTSGSPGPVQADDAAPPGFWCSTAGLDAAFANLHDSIFILDRGLTCIYARAPVLNPWEATGRTAEWWAPFFTHIRDVFTTGEAVHGEVSPDTAARGRIVCEYLINPLHGPSGSVDHLFVVCRNVSEQRHLETALRKSREQYRALFESMATGFACCEIVRDDRGEPADYRFLDVNPAFEVIFGAVRDRYVGRRLREILPDGGSRIIACLDRTARTGVPSHFEHYSQVFKKYLDIIVFSPERGMLGCLVEDITATRQTEREHARLVQQIRSDRNRLEAVLQQMPCGVILTEASTGRLLLVSDKMQEIWQCPLPEGDAPDPDESDEDVRLGWRPYEIEEYPLSRAIRTGEAIIDDEIEILRGDGTTTHISISAAPVMDPEGAVRYGVITFSDISGRKAAEEELQESEERYRLLFEQMLEKFYLIEIVRDADGRPTGYRCLDANEPAAQARGTSREELLGRRIPEVFPSPDTSWSDLVQTVATTSRPDHREFFDADTRRYYEAIAYLPQQNRVAVFARDITERKQAEGEILMQNRQLAVLNGIIAASAYALSPNEVLRDVLDTTLRHLEFDVGAVYLFDQDRHQAVLRCHRQVPDPYLSRYRTLNVRLSPYDNLFAVGEPRYIETQETASARQDLSTALGVASLAIIPIIAESSAVGALVLGSTGRREIPQKTRRILEAVGREAGTGILRGMLYDRLEAANREANLYLDILTHDIQNTNTIAVGYAGLLDEMLLGEEREYLQRLRAGITKSIEITANVGTIRKIRESQTGLVPVDLDRVIRGEIAHRSDAHIIYDGPQVAVFADDLLPEIFTNLIGNAANHGGPGVEVFITVEDAEEGMIRITVADTGPGVPDEVKESIFARFEQGKGRESGQGLGLSICRMLVTRYGGRIRVEDRVPGHPGCGAAFRFTLRKAGDNGEAPEQGT
ncbi:MAG: PAS domain S-box protein [Methanoculleus sp.]